MDKPVPSSSSTELPSYRKPPVNEVVCGIRFHSPDKLRIPHIGILWNKLRSKYPIIQHAPPIATVKGEILLDSETGLPLNRVWFINESDDQLVQFQFDRFYFNWRRRADEYPRYPHVIKNFEQIYNTILDLFSEFDLGNLNPVECELSYINHIVEGQEWNTIEDLSNIFVDFIWEKKINRFLPRPVKLSWLTEFPLEEQKGRLTVSLKQATRTTDKVHLFILELKALGIGESTSKEAIHEWFDVAHKWIVQGFTDLTTSKVHKLWERER